MWFSASTKLDRNRDTTSQDSGISQMSVGNDGKHDMVALEEAMEELHVRPNYTARSGPKSLPYTVNNGPGGDANGYITQGECF